jgi:hypothetical protein
MPHDVNVVLLVTTGTRRYDNLQNPYYAAAEFVYAPLSPAALLMWVIASLLW